MVILISFWLLFSDMVIFDISQCIVTYNCYEKNVHVWYFVASRVVIFPVYCHPVYFISVYISGEVPPLSFRQMPNIVYIHDFRRRWPSVYFHWSDIQFQFGAIYFTRFHFTLELVIISYVTILCSDIYVHVHVVIRKI